MRNIKWAIELKTIQEVNIEKRVLKILTYFEKSTQEYQCQVSNFDGTGFRGNNLTNKTNDKTFVDIPVLDLIQIFSEDGQVFDMDLKLYSGENYYQMIISRGEDVNVLGNNQKLPDYILGPYTNLDIGLFSFNDTVT